MTQCFILELFVHTIFGSLIIYLSDAVYDCLVKHHLACLICEVVIATYAVLKFSTMFRPNVCMCMALMFSLIVQV
jgi:hypothetical protein